MFVRDGYFSRYKSSADDLRECRETLNVIMDRTSDRWTLVVCMS